MYKGILRDRKRYQELRLYEPIITQHAAKLRRLPPHAESILQLLQVKSEKREDNGTPNMLG